jgi:hypothetical protein
MFVLKNVAGWSLSFAGGDLLPPTDPILDLVGGPDDLASDVARLTAFFLLGSSAAFSGADDPPRRQALGRPLSLIRHDHIWTDLHASFGGGGDVNRSSSGASSRSSRARRTPSTLRHVEPARVRTDLDRRAEGGNYFFSGISFWRVAMGT